MGVFFRQMTTHKTGVHYPVIHNVEGKYSKNAKDMLSFTQGCIIKMWGIAYFAGRYWLNLRIVNITVFEAPNFLLILKLGEVGCDYMGPQKGKRKPYTCKRL